VTNAPDSDNGRVFAALPRYDNDAMARLQAVLASKAQQEDILDLAYRTMDTPVGSLLLAATEQGLVKIAYAVQDHTAVLQQLSDTISPRILLAPARLDEAARQIDAYFAGHRTGFDLPLDWRLSKGFRRDVLSHLPQIGYGSTQSYAQVALASGSPRAVRAVGTACATNPLPLVVPCHRVVRSDGTAGRYVGGKDAKNILLTLEAAA
jgi:methylated-DNA-[protein]-cysteine S-methyltransferase